MRTKDSSVECYFHPVLTDFLFECDQLYREWSSELTITSGSESSATHSYTSLHYATPGQAADTRCWTLKSPHKEEFTAKMQHTALQAAAKAYCESRHIPTDWIEVILEFGHIHIEYQPKRQKRS